MTTLRPKQDDGAHDRGADGCEVEDLRARLAATERRLAATERRLAAAEPRLTTVGRSEAAFRAVFDDALDGMLVTDDDGRYVDVNPAACTLLGCPREQVLGRHAWDFFAPPYHRPDAWRAVLAAGTVRGELALTRRDGETRLLELTARANVLPGHHLSIVRDVTEQRRTEDALRLSEELFAKAFRVSPIPLGISTAAEGRFVDINDSAVRLIGRPRDAVIGRTSQDLGLWADADHTVRLLAALDEAGETRDFATRLRTGSGEVREVMLATATIVVQGERCFLGVLLDVTEQKRAQRALEQSQYFLERAQTVAHIGSWVWDIEADAVSWSRECERIFGLTEHTPRTAAVFFARVHPDDTPVVRRAVADALAQGTAYELEYRFVRADGVESWVLVSAEVERDARGVPSRMIGVVKDTTQQRRTQAELRASETRYRRIVETAAEGIWLSDARGRIAFVNARMAAMLGYTTEEMIGRETLSVIAPEHRATVERYVERRRHGLTDSYSVALVRRSGDMLIAEVRATPLIDAAGCYEGSLAMVTDVTERHRAEQERTRLLAELERELAQRRSAERALASTEEQLRQLQKLDAIGGLAAGIAHDFNNILTVIISYATLASNALRPGEPLRDDLTEILGAAERAADLTRQLLAFSRRQVLEPRVVHLGAIIAGTERMIRRLLGEHITLAIVTTPGSGRVLVDPGQFEQVILNVVVNARDAMPRGGRLTIETAGIQLDEAGAREIVGARPGEYVKMAVSDTGIGMDAQTRDRMFEPFFTTKDKGKGTGLGLATVYGIVKQSGGHLRVQSEPGRGTTIEVYLPCTDRAAPEAVARASMPAPSLRGCETILVVDDEERVRQIVCEILQRYGYLVLTAANAGEALLLCEQQGSTIDLLLTDVVMPVLGGRALAERLTRMNPALRVLFVSGYTDDAIVQHGVAEEGVAFLQKPIRPDVLARKVREVLDARATR